MKLLSDYNIPPTLHPWLTRQVYWHIGGSRGAGVHSEKSDWDFIVLVESAKKAKRELREMGFKERDDADAYIKGSARGLFEYGKDVDVIVTTTEADYMRWDRAKELC